jgi:N-methylhydantoinase B/oxoprolinase/acetone carboxylase alpha subunit
MMQSGGGDGFGDPIERDQKLVAEDVREGYASASLV